MKKKIFSKMKKIFLINSDSDFIDEKESIYLRTVSYGKIIQVT